MAFYEFDYSCCCCCVVVTTTATITTTKKQLKPGSEYKDKDHSAQSLPLTDSLPHCQLVKLVTHE